MRGIDRGDIVMGGEPGPPAYHARARRRPMRYADAQMHCGSLVSVCLAGALSVAPVRAAAAPASEAPAPVEDGADAAIDRARALDHMTCPVGQIVGDITHESSVRQRIYDILDEFAETMSTLPARAGLE